jgi:hypothetical protein
MHKEMMVDLKRPKKEHLMHYNFILKMYKALTSKWGGRKNSISSLFDSLPGIHCLVKTNIRRLCVKCKKRTNCMCPLCSYQWQCFSKDCFQKLGGFLKGRGSFFEARGGFFQASSGSFEAPCSLVEAVGGIFLALVSKSSLDGGGHGKHKDWSYICPVPK